MIDALGLTITLLCLGLALYVGGQTARGRFAWRRIGPLLALVQSALVLQAGLDAGWLATGHHAREPGSHLAYLVTSVLLGPAVVREARRAPGRWGPAALALGLAAAAVLVIRLRATGRLPDA